MSDVPVLRFRPIEPENLAKVLEAQVSCLIDVGVPEEVGVKEAEFLENAMNLVSEFDYSAQLGTIGLDRVWMVHYGVSDRFLALACGVTIRSDANTDSGRFTMFEGLAAPEGLHIVQGQLGQKYQNVAPCTVRNEHSPLEQAGIPKEGLTALLYWGNDLLRECAMYFPGAVITRDDVFPHLSIFEDENPELGSSYGGFDQEGVGSVTVSR